jgi:uncharacterized protein
VTRRRHSLAAACLAAALILPARDAAAQQQTPGPNEPVVVTTGEAVVTAVPDRAFITVGAESRAASPREAQRLNTVAMNPVLDKLKAAGIAAEAIRTIGYDVQYEWDYANNKRVGRGYVARNTVEVRIDNVERVGEYLEIAGSAGATSLGGIRFDLKDRDKLTREALRQAVTQARGKADAAAAGAGRTIDRIIRIDEQGSSGGPPPRPIMYRAEAAQAKDAAAPISSGEIELRATVSVTATLK